MVAVLSWTAISSLFLVLDPTIAVGAALGPLALYGLITKSWLRVLIVIGGGMLVLGSTSEVGAAKVLYSAALLLCGIVSAVRLAQRPPTWIAPFKSLVPWGAALIVCLLLGTLATPGQDVTTVIRQAIFYLMIPIAPLVGIDAGRDARSVTALRFILVIGCIAAAGFAADWLNRRGVSNLSFGRFVVSSLMLPAFVFALALVKAGLSSGWARFAWAIPVVVIPSAMLVTGTRTNLIIFLALLGVLGSRAKMRVPPLRAMALVGSGGLATALLLPVLAGAVVAQPGFLESRMQALFNVVNGSASDMSFEARNEQYYYSSQWINESPWFGKGPGFSSPISLDTPLATVVHLGIIGTLVLCCFLVAAVLGIRKSGLKYGRSEMHTAVTGTVVVVLANLPFGTPFADRGFGFMLTLIFFGVSAILQERESTTPAVVSPPKLPHYKIDIRRA